MVGALRDRQTSTYGAACIFTEEILLIIEQHQERSPQESVLRVQERVSRSKRLTIEQEISKIADVDVYITKPADYPHSPSKLLLFLTGGTGIHSINNQLQADKYAAEGFLVVMPDQYVHDIHGTIDIP